MHWNVVESVATLASVPWWNAHALESTAEPPHASARPVDHADSIVVKSLRERMHWKKFSVLVLQLELLESHAIHNLCVALVEPLHVSGVPSVATLHPAPAHDVPTDHLPPVQLMRSPSCPASSGTAHPWAPSYVFTPAPQ